MLENAIDEYLAMRHAAGYELEVPEYLLRSFVRFAFGRGETHVYAQSVIDWASEAPSLSQRDHRLIGKNRSAIVKLGIALPAHL